MDSVEPSIMGIVNHLGLKFQLTYGNNNTYNSLILKALKSFKTKVLRITRKDDKKQVKRILQNMIGEYNLFISGKINNNNNKHNINKKKKQQMIAVKKDPCLIVRNSDKGGGPYITETAYMNKMANKALDSELYSNTNYNEKDIKNIIINNVIPFINSNEFTYNVKSELKRDIKIQIMNREGVPNLYLMAKKHKHEWWNKDKTKFRQLIKMGKNNQISKLSSLFGNIINKMNYRAMKKLNFRPIILNSFDLINKIVRNIESDTPISIDTRDIESMYNVIKNEHAIEAIRYFGKLNNENEYYIDFLINYYNILQDNAYVKYNERIVKLKEGQFIG